MDNEEARVRRVPLLFSEFLRHGNMRRPDLLFLPGSGKRHRPWPPTPADGTREGAHPLRSLRDAVSSPSVFSSVPVSDSVSRLVHFLSSLPVLRSVPGSASAPRPAQRCAARNPDSDRPPTPHPYNHSFLLFTILSTHYTPTPTPSWPSPTPPPRSGPRQ